MAKDQLTKEEAGRILQRARDRLGKRQEQVIAEVGIPTITQLSEYENGKVSIARSKYFPKLAQVLRLTEDEIRAINPNAVFTMQTPAEAGREVESEGRVRDLPPALERAIEMFGDENPGLKKPYVQQQLRDARFQHTPQTPGQWLSFYLSVAKWIEE